MAARRNDPLLNNLEAFLEDQPHTFNIYCAGCRIPITNGYDFIQDLYPFSTTYLLFNDCTGVSIGQYSEPIYRINVGEASEENEVTLYPINCDSCGNCVGWRIMTANDSDHPVISTCRSILVQTHNHVGGVKVVFLR